jgi:hypothetical protein
MKNIIFLASNLNNKFYRYIESLGYEIIKIEKSSNTYDSISNHPDIFVFSTGRKVIVDYSIYDELKSILGNCVIKGDSRVQKKYPNNIQYNVAKLGEYAIHNKAYTDRKIIENINCKWINVKQGYSKCNTLIVDDNSIITSDKGIYEETIKFGLKVLLIRPGDIILKGLNYGFIGGTSVRIENEIVFYGDIRKHRDYEKIEMFIENRNLKIKYFNFDLEDIGSCIIMERK